MEDKMNKKLFIISIAIAITLAVIFYTPVGVIATVIAAVASIFIPGNPVAGLFLSFVVIFLLILSLVLYLIKKHGKQIRKGDN